MLQAFFSISYIFLLELMSIPLKAISLLSHNLKLLCDAYLLVLEKETSIHLVFKLY